jgi:hypothetical protein
MKIKKHTNLYSEKAMWRGSRDCNDHPPSCRRKEINPQIQPVACCLYLVIYTNSQSPVPRVIHIQHPVMLSRGEAPVSPCSKEITSVRIQRCFITVMSKHHILHIIIQHDIVIVCLIVGSLLWKKENIPVKSVF